MKTSVILTVLANTAIISEGELELKHGGTYFLNSPSISENVEFQCYAK